MAIGSFTVWLFVLFIFLSIKGVKRKEMGYVGKIADGIEVFASNIQVFTRGIGGVVIVVTEAVIAIAKELGDVAIVVTEAVIAIAKELGDVAIVITKEVIAIVKELGVVIREAVGTGGLRGPGLASANWPSSGFALSTLVVPTNQIKQINADRNFIFG